MTQEDVAERTGKDRSTLYRLETALQRPQRSTLIQLMDIYGVDDPQRAELLTLLKESAQRGWMQPYRTELPEVYSDYIGFEDEARSISNYQSLFVPGLLQTEDYARAVIRGTLPHASPEEVENRVLARMGRQALLTRDDPPRLWAIMDEAAARRQVGGRQVMAAQLARLAEAAALPNVTLQVIPFAAVRSGHARLVHRLGLRRSGRPEHRLHRQHGRGPVPGTGNRGQPVYRDVRAPARGGLLRPDDSIALLAAAAKDT